MISLFKQPLQLNFSILTRYPPHRIDNQHPLNNTLQPSNRRKFNPNQNRNFAFILKRLFPIQHHKPNYPQHPNITLLIYNFICSINHLRWSIHKCWIRFNILLYLVSLMFGYFGEIYSGLYWTAEVTYFVFVLAVYYVLGFYVQVEVIWAVELL